jgi:hypothetical protein
MLVGAHCLGKVLRVLTGKARPSWDDADTMLAMTPGAHADGTASGCWIPDERG